MTKVPLRRSDFVIDSSFGFRHFSPMSPLNGKLRMPSWNVFRSCLAARWILAAAVLLAVAGCGKKNPVRTLRKDGAEVKFDDRYKQEKVTSVQFPKKAGDQMVALLKDDVFSDVAEIDLSDTKITDDALESIKPLSKLRRLNLSGTKVTDAGLEHLKDLPALQRLDLGDTLVTVEGLKKLEGLKSLTELLLVGEPKPKVPKRRSWDTAFRLGIDLAGGTNLVYQVVGTLNKPLPTNPTDLTKSMDQMVGAVKRRLDPSGTEEITVRRVGSDRIEVIIPRADPEVVVEKKRMMTRLGSLEFAMLANRRDHRRLIDEARGVERDVRKTYIDENGETKEYIAASWREVAVGPDGKPKSVSRYGEVETRPGTRNKEITEFLVVFEVPKKRITGQYLRRAYSTRDENARPAVGFEFNTRGASLFSTLTGNNLPMEDGFRRRLAILLDDKIHSAPSIESRIQGRGIIHGSFTDAEVEELVNVLNAGALVLEFRKDPKTDQPTPISEQTISPLLGADVQSKGKRAVIWSVIVVLLFMAVYYLFAGVVADICLLLNIVLVLGTMAFIDAAFTLPGIAGIVLTIGMAVDANVLIFERIREEQNRGSSLRMSIQNGFGRAFTTIVDSNLTTLITAVVLYMIGTDQVRGFAVTLFIGIVLSMFTALYFGRLIFDVFERKRWIRTLKMNSLVRATNWDFVGKTRLCITVSLVLIVAGMAGVVMRGADMLDIDFRGGTMVTFEFKKKQDTGDVKDVLANSDAQFQWTDDEGNDVTLTAGEVLRDGLTVEELTVGGEEAGTRFRARGTEKVSEKFKTALHEALEKAGPQFALRQVRIASFSPSMIQTIEKPAARKKKQKKPASEEADEPPQRIDTAYVGGHKVRLSLTDDGLKLATFRDYVSRKLQKKHSRPGDLIRAEGITPSTSAQPAGEAPKYSVIELRAKPDIQKADLATALVSLKKELDETAVFPEVNNFDAAVAGDMQVSAVEAMLFSLVAVIAYIWFRFQRATFGIAAVVALVHDVLVVLGIVALAGFVGDTGIGEWLNFKINLPMIAALLTLVGYSLNDTIVVFDRIREVRGKNPAMTNEMVNDSINQTLSRTLLTSFTTWIVVAILYVWGGEGIRGFAFSLVAGIIVGTYSSIYIASPVLVWLMNRSGSATARAASSAALREKTAAT
jgi:SecD/SecF fusion protein